MDPDFYEAYRDKAEVYYNTKEYDKSLENAQKALAMNNIDGWCHVNMGKLYYVDKDYDKTIASFTRAIELLTAEDPLSTYNAGLFIWRASCYLKKGMIKEAIADYRSAAGYDPHAADVIRLLGII